MIKTEAQAKIRFERELTVKCLDCGALPGKLCKIFGPNYIAWICSVRSSQIDVIAHMVRPL